MNLFRRRSKVVPPVEIPPFLSGWMPPMITDAARCVYEMSGGRENKEVGTMHPIPSTMKSPRDIRPVWRGGVLQIWVTRACDLACTHCTQGSNLAGKPGMMTPDQFEEACKSLVG